MTTLNIRKSGGTNIVSLPKKILETLGLRTGSTLNLSVEHNKIVLTPNSKEKTLNELLSASPKECLQLHADDTVWLTEQPQGNEAW